MTSVWQDVIVPDIRALIRVKLLDPVTALALALSCKEELLFLMKRSFRCGSLNKMVEYGHDALALQCYPKQIISFGTSKLARYGALMCLIYAHENGADWHDETTKAAARGGHLSCLIYAHENGVEWHDDTTWTAAGG